MSEFAVDRRYYEAAGPKSAPDRLMRVARRRIVDKMIELHPFRSADEILDVGVSDFITGADNMLERLYPYPWRITALGLGAGDEFRREFPQVKYAQISGKGPLPFSDRSFSCATSNAVLEHLGSNDAQEHHLTELLRVAERVFITVPNRWFPVEHHTGLPFVHWSTPAFRLACRAVGKASWARQEELMFITARSLNRLVQAVAPDREYVIGYTGIAMGRFSSNLFLSIK
jgi:hypothetical protein